ncbi:MAG: hypothetical protein H7Z39_12355 [Burkholderiaceae bacterium]|nr:hypothetical protein [Burkholderiaceae bacterium]
MSKEKFVFVVGDKFTEFGQHEQVVTLSGLNKLLRQEGFATGASAIKLVAGQGISEADVQRIIDAAPHQAVDRQILLNHPVRASLRTTHKRRLHNSIISSPRQLSDKLYEVDLLVDERSELMRDHQTGQHIQGMILVEAARQMFLAVTEDFFIEQEAQRDYYFVINQMDVKYTAFVFPIGALLRYEIIEQRTDDPDRLSFTAKISVLQAEVAATEVLVKFTAFLAANIKKKEHQQAMLTLQKQQNLLARPLALPLLAQGHGNGLPVAV